MPSRKESKNAGGLEGSAHSQASLKPMSNAQGMQAGESGVTVKEQKGNRIQCGSGKSGNSRLAGVLSNRSSARGRGGIIDTGKDDGGFKEDKSQVGSGFFCCSTATTLNDASNTAASGEE